MRRWCAVLLLCLASLDGRGYAFDPSADAEDVGCSYFARAGRGTWRARLPEGNFRYLYRAKSPKDSVVAVAPEGWVARIKGKRAELTPPKAEKLPHHVEKLVFEEGRLVELIQDGKTHAFRYPDVFPCAGELPRLWRLKEDYKPSQLRSDIWRKSGRFRLGYKNPNCFATLMAELIVLGVALVFFRRIWWRILGGGVATVCLTLMCLTQSRCALLAFLLSMAILLVPKVFRGGLPRGRRLVVLVLVGFAVALTLFFGYRSRIGHTRRSDTGRTETLRHFTQMVASAPGGWNELWCGLVYVKWFQNLQNGRLVRDMINEHLTYLVMHDWVHRLGYLFGWFAVLLFLWRYGRKGGSYVPLAVWVVYGTTATFNRTYVAPSLCVIPFTALAFAVVRADWRRDGRGYAGGTALALALAALVLTAIQIDGSWRASRVAPRLYSDGTRVLVNGREPGCWLVDDPATISMNDVGKDIRAFYMKHPQAPSLGYARAVSDVPEKVARLVLVGRRCREFVEAFRANNLTILPESVVFISPDLSPAEIPDELVKRFRLRVYAGEFLVRHWADDIDWRPPNWVTVVPGAEVYLSGWMRLGLKGLSDPKDSTTDKGGQS